MIDLGLMGLCHVGIAVPGIEEFTRSWGRLLGVTDWLVTEITQPAGLLQLDGEPQGPSRSRIAMARLAGTAIELVEPLDGRTRTSAWLETHGPGIHHLAFWVRDLDQAVAALAGHADITYSPAARRPGTPRSPAWGAGHSAAALPGSPEAGIGRRPQAPPGTPGSRAGHSPAEPPGTPGSGAGVRRPAPPGTPGSGVTHPQIAPAESGSAAAGLPVSAVARGRGPLPVEADPGFWLYAEARGARVPWCLELLDARRADVVRAAFGDHVVYPAP